MSLLRSPSGGPGARAVIAGLVAALSLSAACAPDPTDEGATSPDLMDPSVDPPPTCASTLPQRLTVTPIGDTRPAQQIFATPLADQGVLVAWPAMDGVHLTRTDAAGARMGKDLLVPGVAVYGLASRDGAYGVLVSRGTDSLYLVLLAPDGAVLREERLLGGVDQKVVNNQWFGTGIRAGRLLWTGTQWAAYFTVQRLWPDNIAHYGDTLRLLQADGKPMTTVWDWGCSHSMEVRLAQRPGQLGAACSSDCYPQKGVLFNHNTPVYGDSSANCGGSYGTHLGGMVALPDGFWLAYTAKEGRASGDLAVSRIGANGKPAAQVWLSTERGDETGPRLVHYGDELLLAYRTTDNRELFVRANLNTGAALGPAEPLAGSALGSASDFYRFGNGDVGWAQASGAGLAVVRLRACR